MAVKLPAGVYSTGFDLHANGVCLLIVDPQNDFHPGGSLAVAGAGEDALNIAKLIEDNAEKIDEIYVTLDSHQKYHIAHPLYWINDRNEHPTPFSTITKALIESGDWKTSRAEHQEWGLHYVSELERKGNFDLTIWPEHCLIGTPGHCVNEVIQQALHNWEESRQKCVHYIMKGNNSRTEHYSAIKAEVIVPGEEAETGVNESLLAELKSYSRVLICGQASSHCVNFTVRDIASNWSKESLGQLEILEDAMSPVGGFEKDATKFFQDMKKSGLTITSTAAVKL
mmetsp:Transcript_11083/g.12687  ORF Transcript_11083/g.12687 Transcript_11083/m.12687 type:complete len:283 (-) Transcript_11083:962-1810(-)|eukprot:CAMPEP_0184036378 /NCGR_PEP_ID=MMETSP0955-20130417/32072_1 /TAXON_ID=627963 /ORGANISM="Aplanochytrium sp, Strain PBS07" /LENGTH=282 /DNA_ID=CAMNT_0026324007 /DNA_START=60 /DNA_END=908 /DNA_ORIENTATION=-